MGHPITKEHHENGRCIAGCVVQCPDQRQSDVEWWFGTLELELTRITLLCVSPGIRSLDPAGFAAMYSYTSASAACRGDVAIVWPEGTGRRHTTNESPLIGSGRPTESDSPFPTHKALGVTFGIAISAPIYGGRSVFSSGELQGMEGLRLRRGVRSAWLLTNKTELRNCQAYFERKKTIKLGGY